MHPAPFLVLLLPAVALGADWSDFEPAFPLSPCSDGWVACRADDAIDPDRPADANGRLAPPDLRVGWFDLEATAVFSPWSRLGQYQVAATPRVDPPPVVAPDLPEVPRGGDATAEAEQTNPTIVVRVDPLPPSDPPVETGSLLRPPDEGPDPVLDDDGAADLGNTRPPVTCDDLVSLELTAMVGRLTPEQIGCIEATYAAASKQTDKSKASRMLIANAHVADRRAWPRLVERHLDEVERSDPDMTYAYARWCLKHGRNEGAILWADTAMERREAWSGHTYTSRVLALYKTRSEAAHALWEAAEARHAAAPTEHTGPAAEDARGRAKTLSREWVDYAVAAELDSTEALAMCTSAAGTTGYCQGD